MRIKNNKKLCTILASTLMFSSMMNVYAKPIDELYVSDFENYEITVKGSELTKDSTIALFITQKDEILSDTTESELNNGYFQFISVDSEGKYTHTFQFDGKTDIYKAYIGQEGKLISAIDSYGEFKLVSLDDLNTAVFNISNNITKKEDIYNAIKDFDVIFDVDFSEFAASNFVKEEINSVIDSARLEIKNGGIQKLKEKVNLVKDRRELLKSISKATLPVEVSNLLGTDSYNKKYELDLSSYNALRSGKDIVCKGLINSYDKYDDFIKKLNELVNSQINNIPTPTPSVQGGSGISGGGGGFSYGKNTSASITVPDDSQNIKNEIYFSDVSEEHWAFDAINYLKNKNIISGYNGLFNPQNNVTREELMKMIVTAFNLDTKDNDSAFLDLDKTHWAYPYVSTAYKNNIAKGIGDNKFGVGLFATREDIALFIYRALNNQGNDMTSEETSFTDKADISEYAYEAVLYLKNKNILNGYEDGSFKPKKLCTRAEVAKILYSILEGGVQ